MATPRWTCLAGDRFGSWTVIDPAPIESPVRRSRYRILCRCECGREIPVLAESLRKPPGGCCKHCIGAQTARHGHCRPRSGTAEYRAWSAMKQRCYSPRNASFDCYGARGVQVCELWRNSFQAFLADMGFRPSSEHSLDRIDSDGDYTPSNCRWSTGRTQSCNRRTNVRYTLGEETLTRAEWARRAGFPASLLAYRLRNGWSIEQAISTPPRKERRGQPRKVRT